jgi:ATP-dependent Clp protease protease subunit
MAKRKLNKDYIDLLQDSDLYLPSRTLFINKAIDDDVKDKIIKGIHVLDNAEETNGSDPFTVILSSGGGEVYSGFGIYDAIKACKNHVTIKVFGNSMSMAAAILQAADLRVVSKNAKIMIHYGSVDESSESQKDKRIKQHSKDYIQDAKEEEDLNTRYENILLEKIQEVKPNFTRKKLQQKMAFNWYLSPEEAIELGLADKIIGEE